MVAAGRQGGGGLVDNISLGAGKRFGLGRGKEGGQVAGGGANAKLERTERNGDIELFVENVALADDGFDEIPIFSELGIEERGGGGGKLFVEKGQVVADVFLFGNDDNLDGESERI